MTSPDHSTREHADDADRVGQLVRLAGRRPAPDPEHVSRARAAAHHEWVLIVERRKWRLPFWSLTAAAIVVGLLGAVAWSSMHRPASRRPGIDIATLQTMTGAAQIASAGERPRPARAGLRIREGDRIETTADGRAALAMAGGLSVRFDRASAAVLDTADRLVLASGAVYVDAGPGAAGSGFRVETPFGVVRHTGTQFEVRLDPSALTLRVREGSVAVETPGGRWTTKAGEALVATRSAPPVRSVIAASGPEWNWVRTLAEPFRLEGAAVPAFLQWVSREQGWRWEYADPSLAPRVARIVLHGSIEGLTPDEALAAVLPTCGLTSRLEGERLIVGAAR